MGWAARSVSQTGVWGSAVFDGEALHAFACADIAKPFTIAVADALRFADIHIGKGAGARQQQRDERTAEQ